MDRKFSALCTHHLTTLWLCRKYLFWWACHITSAWLGRKYKTNRNYFLLLLTFHIWRKARKLRTGVRSDVSQIHGGLTWFPTPFSASSWACLLVGKNGLPSPERAYVFNGDFVDRGKDSVEILMVLFAFMLVYPKEFHLNRGNHEDYLVNLRYKPECGWVFDIYLLQL